MIRSLFLLSAMILISSLQAWGQGMDLATERMKFESQIQGRMSSLLDAQLGKGQYAVELNTTLTGDDKSNALKNEVYFPKLGLSNRLSSGYDPSLQFENYVRSLDLKISYSQELQGVDPTALKKKIESNMKAFGKFPTKVSLETFEPAESKSKKDSRSIFDWFPFTPVSILICGLFLAFALAWGAQQISRIKLDSGLQNGLGPASALDSSLDEAQSGRLDDSADSTNEKQGLTKWSNWAQQDFTSANQFLVKMSRAKDDPNLDAVSYLLQQIDIPTLKKIFEGLDSNSSLLLKTVSARDVQPSSFAGLDRLLLRELTVSFVESQGSSEELSKSIHHFSTDECVLIANERPEILGLYIKTFSTPMVEQILQHLSIDKFEQYVQSQRSNSNIEWKSLVAEAQSRVQQIRKETVTKLERSTSKWLLVASHLDLEKEKSIYESSVQTADLNEVLEFAVENFPQFLVPELSSDILKPVLNSVQLNGRVEILAALPDEVSQRLLKLYDSDPKVYELLESDLEIIRLSEDRRKQIQANRSKTQKEFFHRVRRYVRSSEEHKKKASQVLTSWFERRGGSNANSSKAA